MKKSFVGAVLALATTAALAQGASPKLNLPNLPNLPVAEVQNVPSVLHGATVPDPYRWLEDVKSPKAQTWMGAQGDATRALLDRIDQREQIERRIAELSRASGDVVRSVTRLPGERLFYLKRIAGERQFKLMTRQGLGGAEKVVFDPEREAARTGVPHAVDFYEASWDGRKVAVGVSGGGSEDATLHVLDVHSGAALAQPVPRATADAANWLPDSRSLLVNQLKERKPGDAQTEYYLDSRVLWVKLAPSKPGSESAAVPAVAAEPQPVFGPTVTPQLGLERLDVAEILTAPGSRWMVARTTDTTVPEGKLFVAPLAMLGKPGIVWRQIGKAEDGVQAVALRGDTLLVMTRTGAPRRKVVAVDLIAAARKPAPGTLAQARLVVAEPTSGQLEWFQSTQAGVVAGQRSGTSVLPREYLRGDTAGRALPGLANGAAWAVRTPVPAFADTLHSWNTWTAPATFRTSSAKGSADSGLQAVPPPLPGAPEVVVTEVEFPSHDGVVVPMTVLHRQGLKLDGSNPVLLDGYASYGFSVTAGWWPARTAWIERGGVLAYVNARGSGVHGDDWHRAGFKLTKRNTWLDGVAAARWLIARGYGSPQTMTAMGTSAGGVFVGRATTTAPELFAAAIYNVGTLDMVRVEESANGITNISESGTVKKADEFKALLEMSTYHAIKDGTAYPGVLLVHGMNDPRVDVWHSAKTAARLQAANPGGRPALLRLDAQAGHGGGSTATQRDKQQADIYAFLLWQTGKLSLKD